MVAKATLIAHSGTTNVDRDFLQQIRTPAATRTHQPLAHARIVETLVEALSFRHISVVRDEYAVSPDGNRMFGVLDLDYEFTGCRFSIGVRNANDKSMRLGLVVGFRVTVCDNMCFSGDFQPMLAKHSRRLELLDLISVGVDKMQRNFEPLKQTINQWKTRSVSDREAKLIIYEAFVEGKLSAPKALLPVVHRNYFRPEFDEFKPATLWSLSNAFTSAFKQLKPFQQFKAAAKLSPFLNRFELNR